MLEMIGLILALVDIYFPKVRDRIEAFLDRQADLAPTRIRPLKRLGALALGIAAIGIACAFLVAMVYEPEIDLQSLPPAGSFGEAVGQIIAALLQAALAYVLLFSLAVAAPLLVALAMIGIVALVALPYAVAPVSSFLNKLTGGHAYAAVGLVLALVGFGSRFVS